MPLVDKAFRTRAEVEILVAGRDLLVVERRDMAHNFANFRELDEDMSVYRFSRKNHQASTRSMVGIGYVAQDAPRIDKS